MAIFGCATTYHEGLGVIYSTVKEYDANSHINLEILPCAKVYHEMLRIDNITVVW